MKRKIRSYTPVVPSKTRLTRFRTKMAKVYNRFQTESAQKPYPFGLHTLYDLYLLGDLAIDSEAMRARGIIV